jgi:hypothetical protein
VGLQESVCGFKKYRAVEVALMRGAQKKVKHLYGRAKEDTEINKACQGAVSHMVVSCVCVAGIDLMWAGGSRRVNDGGDEHAQYGCSASISLKNRQKDVDLEVLRPQVGETCGTDPHAKWDVDQQAAQLLPVAGFTAHD